MKRILITGANSYIGTNLERYLLEYNASQGRELYRVDRISQRDSVWESFDFHGYDAVFQASGIAHADTGAVTQEQQALYYQVNCDLAVATARKAQEAGVRLFLYPSSIIVYGDSAPYRKNKEKTKEKNKEKTRGMTGASGMKTGNKVGNKAGMKTGVTTGVITGVITPETPAENPHFYGNSKIRAEEELRRLAGGAIDKDFSAESGGTQEESGPQKLQETEDGICRETERQQDGKRSQEGMQIAILRLPMVYGKGSKGNYPLLARLAAKLPFFPDVQNQRSMIYIENLCEFIRQRIEEGRGGLYFPQNAEYTVTSRMVQEIAAAHGKKVRLLKVMNPLVALVSRMPGRIGAMTNKAFGSLVYDRDMSGDMESYCLYDLRESIRRTEK